MRRNVMGSNSGARKDFSLRNLHQCVGTYLYSFLRVESIHVVRVIFTISLYSCVSVCAMSRYNLNFN